MLIVDILSIQNCNYCIVGFALILILTTDVEILSRANVSAVLLTLGQPACTYSRTCVDVRTYVTKGRLLCTAGLFLMRPFCLKSIDSQYV